MAASEGDYEGDGEAGAVLWSSPRAWTMLGAAPPGAHTAMWLGLWAVGRPSALGHLGSSRCLPLFPRKWRRRSVGRLGSLQGRRVAAAWVTVTGSGLTEPQLGAQAGRLTEGTAHLQARARLGAERGAGVTAPTGSEWASVVTAGRLSALPAPPGPPALGAISGGGAPAYLAQDPLGALLLALPGPPSRPSMSPNPGPQGSSPPLRAGHQESAVSAHPGALLLQVWVSSCLESQLLKSVEEGECQPPEEGPGGASGGPPLRVTVSSQGRSARLTLNWDAPGPGGPSRTLRLSRLSPRGSPEGQLLQAHTNGSSFEFRDLVPGSRYQLEVTAVRPCGQNASLSLTALTAPSAVQDLQLHSSESPSSLGASWGSAPGGQDGYQLVLCHLESQTVVRNVSTSAGTLSYNFSHLLPGSEYVLEITTWAAHLQAKTSTRQWTAPVPPGQLALRALGTRALRASWYSSGGAAWLHLLLTDLLSGSNLTAGVTRGVSSHTFPCLSPGTPYTLTVSAIAGPHWAVGPSATEWTRPSTPVELGLAPQPPGLGASWKAGPGAREGYLLRLSGPVDETLSLGPGALNVTFLGPLPSGHYALELRVLAGPYEARAQAAAWLGDAVAQRLQGSDPKLPLDEPEASKEPGSQTLPYTEGGPCLLRNVSGPPGATLVTLHRPGMLVDAGKQVDAVSPLGTATASPTGHTGAPTPQSLEVTGRDSPSTLTIGWAPAAGPREGYRVSWHQEGGQGFPGGLVNLGPDNASLTLRDLVPGSCYTVSVWTRAGNLSSSIQRARACTLPAPPTSLSLGLAARPPALRAFWSPPVGGRDGFLLRLYRLRPPALEGQETLGPEVQTFSWARLAPGTEFLVWLATLRGPDKSSSANATGWTRPLAPALVNVTSEGATGLRAFWVHALGGRDGYRVTLYQSGVRVRSSRIGAQVDGASFSALIPGTEYEVEVVTQAGPLRAVAASATGWTPPVAPLELLVSIRAGSAVVSLAWASGPLGHGACHAQLSGAGLLSREQPLALGQARLVLRDLTPGCNLSLTVQCRAGPLQASTHPVLLPVEPDPVEDVQCQPETTRLALVWTVPAGDVDTCLVVAEQLAAGGAAQLIFRANTSGGALLLARLAPATSYRLSLSVLGRNGLWSRAVSLVCATVPEAWHPPELAASPQLEPETGMGVLIAQGMFGEEDGQIQWYGVIASTNMSLARPPREAISCTWYDHHYGGRDTYLAVLLSSPFHPGPWAGPASWLVPVGTDDCGRTRDICNGRLRPGSRYRFSVVAFSRHSPDTVIAFSAFSEPRTSPSWAVPLPVTAGIVASMLALVLLGLLCWRRVKGQRAEKSLRSQELTAYNLWRTHRPIPAHSFQQSFEAKSAHAYQAFFQEFEELKEVGKEQLRLEAEHPANSTKNRYPHVLPYDHSRVRLALLDGKPHSDYINASFIPGYTHRQEFIATQGPLKKTLADFWRLVWEQQVQVIVMLTVGMENGRVLCEHYWPADSSPVTHGPVTVRLLAEQRQDEWTTREFQLHHAAQQWPRRVKQLQFTTWPDHSVPEAPSSLLAFVELVREQARAATGTGPLLVHCSAGVGRSGTFVALWRLLRQLEEEQVVDVFHVVHALRLHRPLMIQTPSQYIFLHRCLLSRVLEGPPSTCAAEPQPIPVRNFARVCAERAADGNAGFLREHQLLLQALKDEAGSGMPPPRSEQDGTASNGRCQEWSPSVESGPAGEMLEAWLFPVSTCPLTVWAGLGGWALELRTVWAGLGGWGPRAETVGTPYALQGGPSGRDHVVLTGPAGPAELWELVWEHGACVLVSLCSPDPQEKELWPTETQPVITDAVTARWVADGSAAGWPCVSLHVTHKASGKERPVQRLQFPCGQPGQALPPETLLPFLAAVGQCCSRDARQPGTLLSHCSKGAAQLGTFLALEQLLQQAGAEGSVDIFTAALQQSQACSLMTPTLEQYAHLYSCLNSALADGLP
ncbi:receptor-type tyrosine-protein phosphatase V-like [Budorcas taxicolor]|uniref:receptor-type tyrosine-protein phosphatase V-like n=1 Tax=Budorcas taxicolor TaxID=37181 RepID=UPI0022840832|nr:receptor-type tyrosine-protein phosphatase V-like [Budorcas taxicolor]